MGRAARCFSLGKNETLLSAERKLRRLYLKDLAKILGVTETAASRYCQPRDLPNHREIREPAVRARLEKWSKGRIAFYNAGDPYTPRKQRGR